MIEHFLISGKVENVQHVKLKLGANKISGLDMTKKIKRYDKCRVCGRLLTTDAARKRGYGLKCVKKLRRGFGGIQVEMFEDVNKLARKVLGI